MAPERARVAQNRVPDDAAPAFEVVRVRSWEEYRVHAERMAEVHKQRWLGELELAATQEELLFPGYCWVCLRWRR